MKRIEFKIYKLAGTKCIRKFESLDEAQEWCWTVNTGDNYRIEWAEPFGKYGKMRQFKIYA